MIKITNGSVEREVTKGAFENYFSKLGFELAEKKAISKPEVVNEIKEETEEIAKESEKDSKRSSK